MTMMETGKLYMPTIKTKPIVLQPSWHAPRNVHAIITTCSEEFNLALHVGADERETLNNRQNLNKFLPTNPLWLNQTHSTEVIDWDNQEYSLFDADASITTLNKKVCVVMTADCLPIILTNKSGEFVSAIHAGWRGLDNGIIKNTIDKLSKFKTSEMIAFIGPAINQECFEIGADVKESFISKNPNDDNFFTLSKNDNKFMANLRGIAEQRLSELGLLSSNIFNSSICTKCLSDWFFSYRKNPKTGRFATLIWLD